MTDSAFNLLLEQLDRTGELLVIADENLRDAPLQPLPPQTKLLTNRFDLYRESGAAGLSSSFNDFDFSAFQNNRFDQILYRVSKEKAVVHHIINQSKRVLKTGGQLLLAGGKNEGLKTYGKKAELAFGCPVEQTKQGLVYLARISSDGREPATWLDDQNYPEIRQPVALKLADERILYSKPGLFGWNKIDQGSALLASSLNDFLRSFAKPPEQLLDLGCGYGYLSVMAQRLLPDAIITATDNNAAAVAACGRNFAHQGIKGEVIADDCAENIRQQFDAVICNPPFHQGFDNAEAMTDRFIRAAHRALKPGGLALFVVNRFVPLERKAAKLFATTTGIADNNSFKVIQLEK